MTWRRRRDKRLMTRDRLQPLIADQLRRKLPISISSIMLESDACLLRFHHEQQDEREGEEAYPRRRIQWGGVEQRLHHRPVGKEQLEEHYGSDAEQNHPVPKQSLAVEDGCVQIARIEQIQNFTKHQG